MSYRVILKNIDGAGQNELLMWSYPTVDTAIAAGRKHWVAANIGETQLERFIESSPGWYVAIDDELISMVIVFRDGFVAP